MQFVDTLYFLTEERKQYAEIMPAHSLVNDVLSKQYRGPYQYSFHILRKSYKPVQEMTPEEFTSLVDNYAAIFDSSF
jgi:hypothetical protein